MKKILITGVSGFAGSYLAEYLVENSPEDVVIGTYLSDRSLVNVEKIKDDIHLVKADLTDFASVSNLIETNRPDVIYHLAAISTVSDSFRNPSLVIYNNASAQINLFEALRRQNLSDTKVIVISSANVYGKVSKEDLPINEGTPLNPDNPYAVSKITQDFIALQYFLAYKMPIVRLRPFNHLGPRLNPEISISYFAQQIAKIESKQIEPVIGVGNITSKRDFTDVRDMVRAYVLAAELGIAGEVYNLGSGQSYEIGSLLDKLLKMSQVRIEVKADPSRMRPSDIPELVCDPAKFNNLTGWIAEIDIDTTLEDLLEYWRKNV